MKLIFEIDNPNDLLTDKILKTREFKALFYMFSINENYLSEKDIYYISLFLKEKVRCIKIISSYLDDFNNKYPNLRKIKIDNIINDFLSGTEDIHIVNIISTKYGYKDKRKLNEIIDKLRSYLRNKYIIDKLLYNLLCPDFEKGKTYYTTKDNVRVNYSNIKYKLTYDYFKLSEFNEYGPIRVLSAPTVSIVYNESMNEDTTYLCGISPIEKLNLSVRAHNCLKRAGINTLYDLCSISKTDLMRVRNLGKKAYTEVINTLESYGIHLMESSYGNK